MTAVAQSGGCGPLIRRAVSSRLRREDGAATVTGRICKHSHQRATYSWSSHNLLSATSRHTCTRVVCTPVRAFTADASTHTQSTGFDVTGDNYYSILGVDPLASPKVIKQAYYQIMRVSHPDLGDDEDQAGATDFCILLNEIYETLMDPDKRAVYDEVLGFSECAVNPFQDNSFQHDHVFVDEITCIGCRNCNNCCPSTFAMEDDFGRARVMAQGASPEGLVQEAIDTCPVDCIHWVTAPQLTLLENQMARMERVAVWILNTGGGGGADVFQEAEYQWRKKYLSRQSKGKMWGLWSPSVGSSNFDGDVGPSNGVGDLAAKRATAAAAAAAARRWRDYQRQSRHTPVRLLSTGDSIRSG